MDPLKTTINSQKRFPLNNAVELNSYPYRPTTYFSDPPAPGEFFFYGYASDPDTTSSKLSTISDINNYVGIGASLTEITVKKTTLRFFKSQKFSPKFYRSGWRGGSRAHIKTFKVSSVAGLSSKICLGLGIGLDYKRVQQGEMSPAKFFVNTAVGIGCCVVGGIPGLTCYLIYFVLDETGVIDKVIDSIGELFTDAENNLSEFPAQSTGLSLSPPTSDNIPVYYTIPKYSICY